MRQSKKMTARPSEDLTILGHNRDLLYLYSHLKMCTYSNKGMYVTRAESGSQTPESVALFRRNGGSQIPDWWLKGSRNIHIECNSSNF